MGPYGRGHPADGRSHGTVWARSSSGWAQPWDRMGAVIQRMGVAMGPYGHGPPADGRSHGTVWARSSSGWAQPWDRMGTVIQQMGAAMGPYGHVHPADGRSHGTVWARSSSGQARPYGPTGAVIQRMGASLRRMGAVIHPMDVRPSFGWAQPSSPLPSRMGTRRRTPPARRSAARPSQCAFAHASRVLRVVSTRSAVGHRPPFFFRTGSSASASSPVQRNDSFTCSASDFAAAPGLPRSRR